jgi:uncharacterized membrane protein
MSRIDFMNELESLLSDIPVEERKEALQYYNDYFEDAGTDHEEEIIKELVSPQRIALIIKANLDVNAADPENRGYFTEKGYQDTVYTDEKFELVGSEGQKSEQQRNTYRDENANSNGSKYGQGSASYSNQQNAQQNTQQSTQTKNTNILLIILLCIFAIPVGIPLVFSVFGVFIGIIAAIFGIVIGFGVAGVAMIVSGIALFIAGIIQISVPFIGLLLCGSGLIVLGLGMLFTLFTTWICKKVLPALVRGFVSLCRLPFRNRSVVA